MSERSDDAVYWLFLPAALIFAALFANLVGHLEPKPFVPTWGTPEFVTVPCGEPGFVPAEWPRCIVKERR